jgi:cytohesin
MKSILVSIVAAVVLVGCGPPARNIWQAAADGKIDAVKYHLAAGVDVNVKMKNILATTPLHEAVRNNRKEIVEFLIAQGANVNARDGSGETALYQAAHMGYLELCKLLINNGADLNISTFKITMGHSPLYIAIRNRHADVAELLITSGADVNKKNKFGESPMDMAIHAKLQNIVNLLIEHGAETSALKGKGKTDVTAKAPEISIHDTVRRGQIESVEQYLDAGGDVDGKDKQDKTPLQHAAFHGHKEIAELLISKGADVNAKDIWEQTPLHKSALIGHKETIELLIAKGADVNAKTKGGETPLDTAIQYEEPVIADLLRKHGGKSGAADSIHVAAAVGNIEAVKQHLVVGTDVDAKDERGWTPLHFATLRGHKKVVELLIAKGADVNPKNNAGETPLDQFEEKKQKEIANLLRKHGGKYSTIHFAVGLGNIETVKEFLAAGADANAKDRVGDTPLDWAILFGQPKTADLLRKHGGKTGERRRIWSFELKVEGK